MDIGANNSIGGLTVLGVVAVGIMVGETYFAPALLSGLGLGLSQAVQ